MRFLANLIGLAGLTCGCTQEAALRTDLDEVTLGSRPIADCATDYRLRGQPSERPIEPAFYLLEVLDSDLKGGLEELRAHEPLCLYELPGGMLLLRDGRGIKHYFRQYPKWDYYRPPDTPVTN